MSEAKERGPSPAVAASIIAVVFAASLGWGYATDLDLMIDFGRELYVPWRLSEGEVLYRDIAWFNGPLSQYWNAAVFACFGTSLRVLIVANAAIAAFTTALLFSLLSRIADRLAATIACVIFLSLFAFARLDPIGNDTFSAPYSHEITHGLFLALLSVWLFERHKAGSSPWPMLGCGAAFALASLTKAEISLALGAGLLAGGCFEALRHNNARKHSVTKALAMFAAGASAIWLSALALLGSQLPLAAAFSGLLGSWPSLFGTDIASHYFYQSTLGTLHLAANLKSMAVVAFAQALIVAMIGTAGMMLGRSTATHDAGAPDAASHEAVASPGRIATAVLVAVAAGAIVAAAGLSFGFDWPSALRALPLWLGVLVLALLMSTRQSGTSGRMGEQGSRLTLMVFALALMAKIALRVRLDQYGFALAMPATAVAVAALLSWLPDRITARGGNWGLTRSAALGALAAPVLILLVYVGSGIGQRTEPIGAGPDSFRSDNRAEIVSQALAHLEAVAGPGDSLAVLPEGVMLNYLARRKNPTGFVNFMPPELVLFGEAEMVRAFDKHPPEWIALAHRDTREYGVGFFGQGYGRDLFSWVRAHYRPVARFGDAPLVAGSGFGIELLKRK